MQTILYSDLTLIRNQIYHERVNHTVYSDKEFKLNFHPLEQNIKLLNNHDLIIVSDNKTWVKDEITSFNKWHITYRLVNDSKTEFKESQNTIKLTKPLDLTSLVYYEQFIKPKIYLNTTYKNKKQLLYDINKTDYTYINATGNFYADLNQVPLYKKILPASFIQLTLSLMLPCDNPASFLIDSSHNLCLLANPSSPNPLTELYNARKMKWFKFDLNNTKATIPLVRLSPKNVNDLFNTGKYTMYAVKVGEL